MADPYVFDLDGGRACLDFANTQAFSGDDHLTTYADLLAFAAQSGLLAAETLARLHAAAERGPRAAASTLQRGKALRQALRSIFITVANRQRPNAADLDILNANLAAGLPHACVLPDADGDAYSWGWDGTDELDAPLWPVVRSAADVLTSEVDRPLVRECGAADCVWLFIDATRNRSRQWCSMTSCGNREKARRHYQRVRAQRTAEVDRAPGAAPHPEPRSPRRRAKPAVDASATAG